MIPEWDLFLFYLSLRFSVHFLGLVGRWEVVMFLVLFPALYGFAGQHAYVVWEDMPKMTLSKAGMEMSMSE